MNRNLLRAGALSCALLATTALSGVFAQPAAAQSGLTPSARPAPDGNGIDVITGALNAPLRSVSIGRPGESGLTYVNGFSGGVRQDSFVLEMTGGGNQAGVNIHGRYVAFTMNAAGVYVPDDADGSTLVSWGDDWIYTARDGTRIEFLNDYGDDFVGARGHRIVRADGEVLTYHYKVAPQPPCPTADACIHPGGNGGIRVQSVTSNLGFQLKAEYAANVYDELDGGAWSELTRVTAINNAVDFCLPTADACPTFTQAWPTLSLSESVSGGVTTAAIADNLSNAVTVTTSADGPTSITSPASPAADVSLTYDADGRVATVVRGGGTWSYSYSDSAGQRTTTVTQPLGGTRIYVSDLARSRVLSETDELGRKTSYDYDANGRLTRTTMPEGNYVQLAYDARGNVTETRAVAKSGSGLAEIVTSAAFAATCSNQKICNQPLSVTDARGNTTDFTYDASHGGLLTATAPAATPGAVRPQVRKSYSAMSAYYKNYLGSIVPAPTPVYRLTATSACRTTSSCAGTADEVRSTVAYGSAGTANNLLPTSASSGDGAGTLTATTAQTYDAFGNVLSVDGPLSGADDTVRYRYDALRRPVGTVSADPDGAGPLKHRAQRITYNADGNVTKVERGTVDSQSDGAWAAFAPLQAAETSYDALGRALTRRLTSGTVTHALSQTSYDLRGRPLCTAQRMNPDEYASLPASACDLDTAGDFGPDRIAKTIYDNANQVTQVLTALGTDDAANEVTSTYGSNGQAETVTDGEGNMTTYEYDGHGRLRRTRYPSPTADGVSSTTDDEVLTYDAAGNVTGFENRAGETTLFSFDALGRRTAVDRPGSEADIAYGYDLLGRTISASQTGNQLSFTYDALGRQLTQTGVHGTIGSTYDLAGRRIRIDHPDGYFVEQDHLVTGEMKAIRENGATSGLGVIATFGHDDLGRRTSLTRGNGVVTNYAYDDASRLETLAHDFANDTSNLTLGFDYNPASQITANERSNANYSFAPAAGTETRTHDGLNRIAQEPGQTLTYDARGNLTAEGGRTFGYSSDNRLTSMTGNGRTYGFSYDPAGRLQEITATGIASRGYAWDGDDAIVTYANGAFLVRTVYGPGENEPLYQLDNQGRRTWFAQDERGSMVAGSNATGTAGAAIAYDEYGRSTSVTYQHGYTGALRLRDTGLYAMRARIYDPKLGRFLQADPIGYGDGMNMYAYVGGDPVNGTDPSGKGKVCVAPVGSRIRSACVLVDANGNGLSEEDDLSTRDRRRFAADFAGFISQHGTAQGTNISQFGKPILGNLSYEDRSTVRVTSQFVGAVIHQSGDFRLERTWRETPFIIAKQELRAPGDQTAGSSCHAEACGMLPNARILMLWGGNGDSGLPNLYGRPSDLARVILHETYHGVIPGATGSSSGHFALDSRARRLLTKSGLGGGGCIGLSGFPGC